MKNEIKLLDISLSEHDKKVLDAIELANQAIWEEAKKMSIPKKDLAK